MSDIYSTLNPQQQEAVYHTEGPLLILAGAGSGKTRVLTHRIAYLIDKKGINPWNILAITFTNKAASEMRERVDKIVGFGSESVWVSTFHSTCVRILRRYIDRLGYDTRFAIYDTEDQKTLMKEVCRKLNIDTKKTKERSLLAQISHAKDELITPDEMELNAGGDFVKKKVAEVYPDMQIVGNAKTFNMMGQFFDIDLTDRKVVVVEGDKLSLGKHELTFVMAPMVHWPEVMMEYESTDKVLFSADGFGKFGALDTDEDWTCEARRYYFNIVGKYGAQVQAVLKKAAGLDIEKICPLHGPILTENLGFYIDKYNTWSSYQPEDEGILVACASIHGNTKKAAELLAEKLKATGVKVAFTDLCRDDMAEAVEDAFRYDRLVLCACTYDGGIFPPMEDFLHHLKAKAYQNRKIAFVENGSWAPTAARQMKAIVEGFKNIECVEPVVTIKSTLNEASEKQMDELVAALTK